MTTKLRTDVHSPTNMDPAAYEYLYAYDSGAPGCLVGMAQSDIWHQWKSHLAPNAFSSQCTHCGAHIRYVALLRHLPTGEVIYVGETCLDGRFALESKAAFDALRKAAQLDREAQRIMTAAAKCIASLEVSPEVAAFLADKKGTVGHHIALDIRSKLYRYGSISARQADLVAKLMADEAARPAVEAARAVVEATRAANATMPPTGRVAVSGTVLSTWWQESDYGSTLKMLVDVGTYRLWGSVPGALSVNKGDTVSFMAQVEAKEVGFGFFRRPTQAKVLVAA